MPRGEIDYVGIAERERQERERYDAIDEEYRHSIYRPFLQGHHAHNCYPPHCGRKFAVYHTVHGYVVPGTECSDRDELRMHLERLNRA